MWLPFTALSSAGKEEGQGPFSPYLLCFGCVFDCGGDAVELKEKTLLLSGWRTLVYIEPRNKVRPV
jgi:hypothetical protein